MKRFERRLSRWVQRDWSEVNLRPSYVLALGKVIGQFPEEFKKLAGQVASQAESAKNDAVKGMLFGKANQITAHADLIELSMLGGYNNHMMASMVSNSEDIQRYQKKALENYHKAFDYIEILEHPGIM